MTIGVAPSLAVAQSTITADQSSSGQMRSSANGTPVVEIAPPNAAGLSHNKFIDLNVGNPGLIFNNSTVDGLSQIGGYVMKNPQLHHGARAILSEVTGPNASQFTGTLEVFGQSADLLVANPNGVILNGVSALNANRLTITTGKPNGDLSFVVGDTSGRVLIDSGGVSTDGLSYFDIVARGVDIRGPVGPTLAPTNLVTDINVIAGQSVYDAGARSWKAAPVTTATVGTVAVSGSAAGAMHGRNISLVSTESGAGVRHPGLIKGARDIVITSQGDIELSSVRADGNVLLGSAGSTQIAHGSGIASGGSVRLESTEALRIASDIDGDIVNIRAGQLLVEAAHLASRSAGSSGQIKGITINAGTFTLKGELVAHNLDGSLVPTDQPLVVKDGELRIQRDSSTWDTDFTLTSTANVITSSGFEIAADSLINDEGILLDTGSDGSSFHVGALINQGLLSTHGSLSLLANSFDSRCTEGAVAGQRQRLCAGFTADGNISADIGSMTNQAGLLANGALTLSLGDGSHTNAQGGGISGARSVTLEQTGASAGLSSGGEIFSRGDLSVKLHRLEQALGGRIVAENGDAHLEAAASLINAGEIRAGQAISILAGDVRNVTGATLMSGQLAIEAGGSLMNQAGTMVSVADDLTMHAGAGIDNAGMVEAGGDLVLLSETGLTNAAGSMTGGRTVSMLGDLIKNEAGAVLEAAEEIRLTSRGDLINTRGSAIFSDNGNVTIIADGDVINNASTIQSHNGIDIQAGGDVINDSGASLVSADIHLDAIGNVVNAAATIQADRRAQIKAGGDAINRDGAAMMGGDIDIDAAGGVANDAGKIQAARNVYLRTNGDVINRDGASVVANDIDLDIDGDFVNDAGKFQAINRIGLHASGGAINRTGAAIVASDIRLDAVGDVTNASAALLATNAFVATGRSVTNQDGAVVSGGSINIAASEGVGNLNGAAILSPAQISIAAGRKLTNDNSLIGAQNRADESGIGTAVTISAADLDNRNGAVIQGKSVEIEANVGAVLNQAAAVIRGIERTQITSAEGVVNDNAAISSMHSIVHTSGIVDNRNGAQITGDVIEVGAESVHNTGNAKVLGGSIGIQAEQSVINDTDGMIRADDTVQIDTVNFEARSGQILANRHIGIGTLEFHNTATIHSKDTASLTINGGRSLVIDAAHWSPTADSMLTVIANGIVVNGGMLNPGGITINSAGDVKNNDRIIAGKALFVDAKGSIYNDPGKLIWAGDRIEMNAGAGIFNRQDAKLMAWKGGIDLTAERIENNLGRISAGSDLDMDAAIITNQGSATISMSNASEVHSDENYLWHHSGRHTQIWLDFDLPVFDGDVEVTHAVMESGRDIRINQRGRRGESPKVTNSDGLIMAAGTIAIDGDLDNIATTQETSLQDYLRDPKTAVSIRAKDSLSVKVSERSYGSLGEFLDVVLGSNDDWNKIYGAYGYTDGNTIAGMKTVQGSQYNKVMSAVLGPDWRDKGRAELATRWSNFRSNGSSNSFKVSAYTEIAAGGSFSHTGGSFHNGGELKEREALSIEVGSEKVDTIAGDFDTDFSAQFDLSGDFNVSDLVAYLNPPEMLLALTKDDVLFQRKSVPPLVLGTAGAPAVMGHASPAVSVPGGFPTVVPLYETRIDYIDQSQFYGSDYFFRSVDYRVDRTLPVIGDAFFDNEMISRTIQSAVGNFFAVRDGTYGADLIRTLMDNAALEAARLGLEIGAPLTKVQYENLNADIVWYEPQAIDGVQVLVPHVYLSKSTLAEVAEGKKTSGTVAARGDVSIDAGAGGVQNVDGAVKGHNVFIKSEGDVVNQANGGAAGGILAGNDGALSIDANGNVDNTGAALEGNGVSVKAGGDISSSTTLRYDEDGNLVSRHNAGIFGNGEDSHVVLDAGKAVRLTGAEMDADTIKLKAAADLDIQDVHEVSSHYQYTTKGRVLGHTSVVAQGSEATSVGSSVSADKLVLDVGGDMAMEGGAITAEQTTGKVKGDVIIVAGKNLRNESYESYSSGLELGASVSGGGYQASVTHKAGEGSFSDSGRLGDGMNSGALGQQQGGRTPHDRLDGGTMANSGGAQARIGYGVEKTSVKRQSTTYDNAQLDLGNGSLEVGGTFDLGGADINAAEGKKDADLAIVAAEVKSTKFDDVVKEEVTSESTFVGHSWGGNSAVVNVSNEWGKKGVDYADGKKEDGLVAAQIAGDVTQMAFDEIAGVSGGVGFSHTQSKRTSESRAENINRIGGNFSLKSTKGDITLTGVKTLNNEATIEIDSAGELNLNAAKSSTSQTTSTMTNSVNATVSAGCTRQGCGAGLSVGYEGAVDASSRSTTTYQSTLVQGANVTLKSKGDATLHGAVVKGRLDVDVGGALNVESVQDTQAYERQRAAWGASGGVAVSGAGGGLVPTGSAHAEGGKDWNNYAVVGEQSGLQGTTDSTITVDGDLNLKGGYLAGNGQLELGGGINAKTITDTHEKDGGYGGGGGGYSKNGMPTVKAVGGRVDHEHYEADNLATVEMTIAGKAQAGNAAADASGSNNAPTIHGDLNSDKSKALDVKRDESYAGTDMAFSASAPVPKKGNKVDVKPVPDSDSDPVVKPKTREAGTQTDEEKPEPKVNGSYDIDIRYKGQIEYTKAKNSIREINQMSNADIKALATKPKTITLKTPGGDKDFSFRSPGDLKQLHGVPIYDGEHKPVFLHVIDYGNGSYNVVYKTRPPRDAAPPANTPVIPSSPRAPIPDEGSQGPVRPASPPADGSTEKATQT
ncbi:hemagglutinin repeat-containing protein [Lysobacter sp. GCM10012299]|uniref:two-partner secretion domain-containing protein n=1 Tax=Lysobacter sp. GCM10012299 TaxID=3317333 RepID=UPI00360C1DF7